MQHDFVLLDRSGSMTSQWDEALGAINTYVKDLADKKVDTGVTLATFDGVNGLRFEIIRDRITPETWRPVSNADAEPRGMTPLNDATAKIVQLAEAGKYDKLALIIMTDGAENDSRELPGYQGTVAVKKMLDGCRAKGWQVIFLGANFDNAAQAASYGTLGGQTVNSSTRNLRATMGKMSDKRADYATGASATMDWSPEEKDEAKKQ